MKAARPLFWSLLKNDLALWEPDAGFVEDLEVPDMGANISSNGYSINGSLINRFQHSAQCIGVSVAFVLFQEDRPRKTGKLRGEERMHAVAHIHALTSQLFQCIRDRSHFHVAKIRK